MKEHQTIKDFDKDFDRIDHFERFPAMKPYVGENYNNNQRIRILLIGESNYMPNESIIHLNAEKWYKSNEKELNSEEINHIHCRQLLKGNWKASGHMIYRELNKVLSDYFDISVNKAITNIAYMNGFQRPAPKTGDSIRNHIKSCDIKISSEVISKVISIISPELIIFVSKLAFDTLKGNLQIENVKCKIDFTCHPASGGRYWNKKSYKHGKDKFKNIINQNVKNRTYFKTI